jgi:hypothetical protein
VQIREEAGELCETLERDEGKERTASEMADLLYHAMVLCNLQGVTTANVMEVGTSAPWWIPPAPHLMKLNTLDAMSSIR